MTETTRRALVAGLAATMLTARIGVARAQAVEPDLSHLTPEQRARYRAMHARTMAAIEYERISVPGAQALAEWQRLKAEGRGWPVVIGSDQDLERTAEQFSIDDPEVQRFSLPGPRPRSPAEIIAAAAPLVFPDDLGRWSGAYQPEDLRAPRGDWPGTIDAVGPGLTIATDILSGQPLERVHILQLPTRSSWEVPAYLRWGGWNACPPPEYHVAALRKWHAKYGAEIVGMNGDTMNVKVAKRPKTRDEAMALAQEQYRYCADIVDQGVGTLSALAALLMASDWWFFWWD